MNTETINHEKLKENITSSGNWIRLLYMLLFGVMLHIAGLVMWVLSALQFLFALFTGKDNHNLRSLGGSIAVFVHQGLDFVCYNTEKKPFPFAAWPDSSYDTQDVEDAVIVEAEYKAEQTDVDSGADNNQDGDNNR